MIIPNLASIENDRLKLTYTLPEWTLINWNIITSVSTNNLDISIKTIQWNNPSVSDPVYIRIWWNIYTITSTIGITSIAWTNRLNSWDWIEREFFVYLYYNNWVQIWVSRVYYWETMNNFTTSNNVSSDSILRSSSTTSDMIVENIWKFKATLSWWYNWSISSTLPTTKPQPLPWWAISWWWTWTVIANKDKQWPQIAWLVDYFYVWRAFTLNIFQITLTSKPINQSFKVDLKKNWVSVLSWTLDIDTSEWTTNNNYVVATWDVWKATITTSAFQAKDLVEIYITQIWEWELNFTYLMQT